MTDNTMREGKLWAFLHDSIHEAYKKLSTTGTSNEYHTMLDSIASKVADDVDARFLQVAQSEQSVPVVGEPPENAAKSIASMVEEWVQCGVKNGGNWQERLPTLIQSRLKRFWPAHSIPAADLATLREKAAEVDELRKDAEIAVTSIYIALDALNEIIEMDGQDNLGDAKREATKAMAQLAAIAQGKGE